MAGLLGDRPEVALTCLWVTHTDPPMGVQRPGAVLVAAVVRDLRTEENSQAVGSPVEAYCAGPKKPKDTHCLSVHFVLGAARNHPSEACTTVPHLNKPEFIAYHLVQGHSHVLQGTRTRGRMLSWVTRVITKRLSYSNCK